MNHIRPDQVMANDKDCTVRHLADLQGVRVLSNGSSIKKHIIIVPFQCTNHFSQMLVCQKRSILRQSRNEIQIGCHGTHRFLKGNFSLIGRVKGMLVFRLMGKFFAEAGIFHVQVNQQHPLAQICKPCPQACRYLCLTLIWHGRGDKQNRLHPVKRIDEPVGSTVNAVLIKPFGNHRIQRNLCQRFQPEQP